MKPESLFLVSLFLQPPPHSHQYVYFTSLNINTFIFLFCGAPIPCCKILNKSFYHLVSTDVYMFVSFPHYSFPQYSM